MALTFDIVLSGLVLGGMYALIAMGLTLQYGIARIMNLSYGELLIASAFAALFLYTGMAVNPILGLLVIVPLSFAANWLLYQIVLMPLVKRAKNQGMLEVDSILGTFGVLFVIQGLMLVAFGGSLQSYSYFSVPVHILTTTLAANRILALLFALVIGGGIYLMLTRTRFGTALRAVAVNPVAAQLSGIDIRAASALAFAGGGAIAAAGGVLDQHVPHLQRRLGRRLHHEGADRRHHGRRRQHARRAGRRAAARRVGDGGGAAGRSGPDHRRDLCAVPERLLWRPTGLFGRPAR